MLEVHNLLSYFVAGAERSDAFKKHRWDGRSSFFTPRSGAFPAGFVRVVTDRLVQLGVQVQLGVAPVPEPLGPSISECLARSGFGPDPRYSYQPEAVEALVRLKKMIAHVATGGGKSNIARLAYWRIGRPTLFLTTRGVLMEQMKSGMEKFGEKVGVLGDSRWEPNLGGFNVAMIQTLAARLRAFDAKAEADKIRYVPVLDKEGKPKINGVGRPVVKPSPAYAKALDAGGKFLETYEKDLQHRVLQLAAAFHERRDEVVGTLQRFEFVILEEAHEVGGDGYYVVMKACSNAGYRLALTATPFMRSSDEASMRLMACVGPIGATVSEKMLIDIGVLATPKFKFVSDIPAPVNLPQKGSWANVQNVGIVDNQIRNERICYEARKAVSHGLSVLILVLRKKHGHSLQAMLAAQGVRARFILGDTSKSDREAALADLESGAISVLIGSTILDIGVDVPSLGMVILAGGGKAEEGTRQRIGRGLRAKKSGPNVALIVDFADTHNDHMRNHAMERRRVIDGTPGFKEGILPPGADFDYSVFDNRTN